MTPPTEPTELLIWLAGAVAATHGEEPTPEQWAEIKEAITMAYGRRVAHKLNPPGLTPRSDGGKYPGPNQFMKRVYEASSSATGTGKGAQL